MRKVLKKDNVAERYDKIGLFSPEIKLENDYRYYSIYQVELFHVILMLKEFGMTLEKIKSVLNHRNEELLEQLFLEQLGKMEEKIQHMKKQKRWLIQLIQHISDLKNLDFDQVSIQTRKERYYVMAQMESAEPKELYQKITELTQAYQKKNQAGRYEMAFLQHEEDVGKGIYDNYQDVLLLMNERPKGMKYHSLPEGNYVIAYHRGHWNSIGEAYERIKLFAKKQQLFIDTNYVEVYMVDRLLVDDFDQYVTEIFVRCLS